MMSYTMKTTTVLLLACLSVSVVADITKLTVKSGDYVCAHTDLKAREEPGLDGEYVLTMAPGDCGTLHGGILTKDDHKWYELDYEGQVLWAAGEYLDKSDPEDGACGKVRKEKACKILQYQNDGVADLLKYHPSGVEDNAYAFNNIVDMCAGKRASISSYACNNCPAGAPGGTTCMTNHLLDYLLKLLSTGRVLINEIAGACHSCTSRHYNGQAVDLHNDERSQEYIDLCNDMDGYGLDEVSHIHCQFYD